MVYRADTGDKVAWIDPETYVDPSTWTSGEYPTTWPPVSPELSYTESAEEYRYAFLAGNVIAETRTDHTGDELTELFRNPVTGQPEKGARRDVGTGGTNNQHSYLTGALRPGRVLGSNVAAAASSGEANEWCVGVTLPSEGCVLPLPGVCGGVQERIPDQNCLLSEDDALQSESCPCPESSTIPGPVMEQMRKALVLHDEVGVEQGGTFTLRPSADNPLNLRHEPGRTATEHSIILDHDPLGRNEYTLWNWHTHPTATTFSLGMGTEGDIDQAWLRRDLAPDMFVLAVPSVTVYRANRQCKKLAQACAETKVWLPKVIAYKAAFEKALGAPLNTIDVSGDLEKALGVALEDCGVCVYRYQSEPEFDAPPPYRMTLMVDGGK